MSLLSQIGFGIPRIFFSPDDGTSGGNSLANICTTDNDIQIVSASPKSITPLTVHEVKSLVHPITTLKDRIGAERHDAMKPVASIQYLLIEFEKELLKMLSKQPGIFELISNLPYDELIGFSNATKKLCSLAEDAEMAVLADPTQYDLKRDDINYFIDKQLLGIINTSPRDPELGSIKSISDTISFISDKLDALPQDNKHVQLCKNFCRDIQDHLSLTSRFLNTVKKFDTGYIGEPRVVDVNSSIREALFFFANDNVAAYLKFESIQDFDSRTKDQQLQISIDPDLLCKVWLNMASNSAEACQRSHMNNVPFIILAEPIADTKYIQIKISDKGPGINPEEICDPNMILLRGVSTKATKENQGLGMDIINQIVVSAGGTINVESNYGTSNSGTTITIRFPRSIINTA